MISSSRAASKFLSCSRQIYAKNDIIFRSVSKTSLSQARIVEVVPALGESITEGSIASWTKNVGDHVAIDDVIVIVETDKVTVDIKSTNAGILIAKLAEDNVSIRAAYCNNISPILISSVEYSLSLSNSSWTQVVVGAPLYELETAEGGAAPVVKTQTDKVAATITPTPSTPETKSHGRVPLIKFLGKRDLMKVVAVTEPTKVASPVQKAAPVAAKQPVTISAAKVVKPGNGVDFSTLKGGAMFGRPALSQREMDAIENGGATY